MSTDDIAEIRADISHRQRAVLVLVAVGLTTKEIAHELAVSEDTVKWHCARLFSKLGVRNRAEAVAEGLRQGLIEFPNGRKPTDSRREAPRSDYD